MNKSNKPQKQSKKVNKIPIEKDVPVELAEIIQDLPKEKRIRIIKSLAIEKRQHSGPLPDAETIKIYNAVIPNGGDRLMKNVEIQLAHRTELEKKGLNRSFNQSSTGQWMGFLIAIFFGLIAWDLAKSGMTVTASIIGTVDLVALVTVFVVGNSKSKKK